MNIDQTRFLKLVAKTSGTAASITTSSQVFINQMQEGDEQLIHHAKAALQLAYEAMRLVNESADWNGRSENGEYPHAKIMATGFLELAHVAIRLAEEQLDRALADEPS